MCLSSSELFSGNSEKVPNRPSGGFRVSSARKDSSLALSDSRRLPGVPASSLRPALEMIALVDSAPSAAARCRDQVARFLVTHGSSSGPPIVLPGCDKI
jgi:hypothetical protein